MTELDNRIALARQLGQVEGRLAALEHKTDHLEERITGRLAGIEGKLDQLTEALHFGRGGWKALALLFTLMAGGMGLAAWLIERLPAFWARP